MTSSTSKDYKLRKIKLSTKDLLLHKDRGKVRSRMRIKQVGGDEFELKIFELSRAEKFPSRVELGT